MYCSVRAEDRKTTMIEKFSESLLIILLQFIILINEFFFFFFIFEFKGSVFENVHNDVLWLFFQENVADTKKSC